MIFYAESPRSWRSDCVRYQIAVNAINHWPPHVFGTHFPAGGGNIGNVSATVWPIVQTDDWCGEFEPKLVLQ